ncbi:MAG: hypothetical protein K6E10_05460, partial [Eubacterium sp.]|nr:hypothetical protein [Eubacterium sp.]
MAIVIISNLITLILTIIAGVLSDYHYLEILLGGIMMLLISAGYLMDGHEKLSLRLEILVAVLFAVFSGDFYGFLIFICIIMLSPLQTIVISDSIYLLYSITNMLVSDNLSGRVIAIVLLKLMILTIVELIITCCRNLIILDRQKREEEKNRMISYSLREMHELKRNRELTMQNYYAEKNARLLERENISRNIHNSVGHSITAAIMTLDAADMLFDKKPEEAHKRMNDANARIRGSLESIRSAVRALDSEDGEVSMKDMLCYFDNIIEDFTMDTDFTCDKIYDIYSESISIPKEHVEFMTGALSEMLTNGVKHGNADHFVVKVTGDSAHIRLEVKDNGKGSFNENNKEELIKKGFGLKKLMSY